MLIQLLRSSLPGSLSFQLVAFLIGLILLHRPRFRRWGLRWLWGLFLLYLGFSMPVVSHLLAVPLTWGFAPLQTMEEARGAEAIVVLDGATLRCYNDKDLLELPSGSSALRALEAARIYRLLGEPLVIVSGGDPAWRQDWAPEASVLRDTMVKLGVPFERIILDSESYNTRAHALNAVRILHDRGISNFVLVTSPTHMRRSISAFNTVGAAPIPSPPALPVDDKPGWEGFCPSSHALLSSEQTMHEYFGLAYYRLQGWL